MYLVISLLEYAVSWIIIKPNLTTLFANLKPRYLSLIWSGTLNQPHPNPTLFETTKGDEQPSRDQTNAERR
jgi:hypothetical protein